MTDSPLDEPRRRATKLGLWGLLANWTQFSTQPWLPQLLDCEETERARRSLERRIHDAKLGKFKPMADFDWNWPKEIDRQQIEELFSLDFVTEPANIIFVGGNGIGKTMIAKNLVHKAILHGHTARVISASELLNDLAAQHSASALERRLRHYCHPQLLYIDEVGYLASSSQHADLLFQIVTRRYQEKSIILTTNKVFTDWGQVFPDATCILTLLDRLTHQSEVIKIDGESYRLKEAKERAAQKKELRSKRKTSKK